MKEKIRCAVQFAVKIKKQYDNAHISAYAAQAAFFMLLSGVPMIMLCVILLGIFSPFDFAEIQIMLQQTVGEKLGGYVMGVLTEITNKATAPLAGVTLVFIVWYATKGIRGIADGLGAIYGQSGQYNIVRLTLRSALYAVVLTAMAVLSLAVLVFAEPVENLLQKIFAGRADFILRLLNMRNVIFFFALTLLFVAAYRYLAKSDLSFLKQLYGAAFAATGWIVFSFGFSVYIKHSSRFSAIYGSLGGVMLFMLWLYMCMNILLCGALVAKLRSKRWQM